MASSVSHLPVPRKRRHHHHHQQQHRARRSASEDPHCAHQLNDNHRVNINNNLNNNEAEDDGVTEDRLLLQHHDDKTSKTRRNTAHQRSSRRAQHARIAMTSSSLLDEDPAELPLPPLPPLPTLGLDNDHLLVLRTGGPGSRRRHRSAPSWPASGPCVLTNINNNNGNDNNNGELAKVLIQNGGTGSDVGAEVTGASNLLARLGITLDLQATAPTAAPNGLHYSAGSKATMHLSKEHVVEVKEEDERRTSPEECERKLTSDAEDDDFEERNKTKMTNSATQTQAGTPGTPTDPRNVTEAGENEAIATASLYHSAWPPLDPTLWHSGPSSLGGQTSSSSPGFHQDNPNTMSASTSAASGVASRRAYSQQQLGAKVEMVYGLLSMLGSHDRQDMSRTLLAMSSSPDSCVAMRQSGCLPLLVQLLYSSDQDAETRSRAAQALHNMVHAHPDDKRGRREARVLKLLEQIRLYCDSLRDDLPGSPSPGSHDDDGDKHPGPTIATLMKLSFDEEHRHAMCQLGGLHAIAQLIQADHEAHGSSTNDQNCVTIRRYAGMALTNLTFGDGTNKALLCSFRDFMQALVAQLASPVEDLRQVTASVLRNLSWRADSQSKQTLREVGAVAALMRAAMEAQKESTYKSVLSALWNLSAHCSLNKVDICAVEGALAFLVQMLSYKAPSTTLAIIENAGGILRNISSHVAVREDYRAILREHNCLQVLLQQLKSPSLTIVSNACGTLWNLSARCQEDQRSLWALGAPAMLRSLVHSKHKMISMGSSATLKNLLSAKPENDDLCFRHLDSTARSLGLQSLPGLYARKQKALEQELDQTLAETCENIEPSTSPSTSSVGLKDDKFVFSLTEREVYRQRLQQPSVTLQKPSPKLRTGVVSHSDSRESVTSTHSDSVYERLERSNVDTSPPSDSKAPPSKDESTLHASMNETDKDRRSISDHKFLQRYNNTILSYNSTQDGTPARKSEARPNVGADQNHNDVAVTHLETGIAEMNITDQHVNRNIRHAWEDSPVDNKQLLSEKEELNASAACSEKEEAVELSLCPKNINNMSMVNGEDPVAPTRTTSSRVPQPRSFVPVRNKYLEAGIEEDLECPTQDRPIDFSRRYGAESEPTPNQESALAKAEVSSIGNESTVVYGDYAETDLDQPTDYSLQYGEEDDLSDFNGQKAKKCNSAEFYTEEVPICIHEDTVKTYCTEGTPYETPCNFSTATSLSDLRIEPTVKEEDEDVKDELEVSSEVKAVSESRPSLNPSSGVIESGSISPAEKPVQFCDEGTPGVCMSRFDSLSSLDKHEGDVDVVDGKLCPQAAADDEIQPTAAGAGRTPPGTPPMDHIKDAEPNDHEANKTAPLSADHQCAEETPLMFSRASSLGSLSSYEQQSILDDRSSVVSEFSRLTSGVLSPSELPDSPSQLIPASPRQTKAPVEFTSRLSDSGSSPLRVPPARFTGSTRPLAHPIVDKSAGNSVFEDRMAAYKVEDTPVEFSRATSLSSLSIDDEPRDVKDGPCKSSRNVSKEEGMEKADVEKDLSLVSEGEEEEDENMLAACINIGMQNSRNKQAPTGTPSKLPPPQAQPPQQSSQQQPLASSSPLQRRRIPMPSGIPVIRKVQSPALTPIRSHSAPGKPTNESLGVCEDSMYRYCTEGTPANISHAGSHSDLSILSFPNEGDEEHIGTELSDDSSNLSGDNENILAECIQSGMPKAKNETANGPRLAPNAGAAAKRASVPNTSLSSRRVASASPSGSVKSLSSPGLSRNLSSSPKRKPAVNCTSQRSLPQASPQRSPQRSLAGSQKPTSAPKPAARVGVRPPMATPSSSPANTGRLNVTPPRPRTGGAKIVRAVNRNVHQGGRAAVAPQCLAANDEMVQFACEDSPCNFSSRSSLSDLTINSSEPSRPPLRLLPAEGPVSDSQLRFATEDTPVDGSYSLSSLGLGDDDQVSSDNDVQIVKPALNAMEPRLIRTRPRRGASAASDSSDRLSDERPAQSSTSEEVLTVLSRNASLSSLSVESLGSCEPSPSEQALLEQCISSGMPKSRSNNNNKSKLPCLVEPRGARPPVQQLERPRLNSESGCVEDAVGGSGSGAGSPEKKLNFVEDVDVMKESAASTGTWADDSSPNEISCPSISISGPTAGSVRSENYRELSDLVEEKQAQPPQQDSASHDLPSLTDSWMLEAEATKVASAVMGHSLNSLDSILPPSEMGSLGSLSQSYSGRSLPHALLNRSAGGARKKSLTAVNDVTTSVEFHLSGSCTSHLDNVKAPSMLDEMGDSENSFMSIASITSETADVGVDLLHRDGSIGDATYELIRPAARQMADAIAKHAFQQQQLQQGDAQEAPSTYHEITELSTDQEDMTLEPGTETIASDGELYDEVADTKTLEAPDLPCDSQHTTPSSSSTSTPKKKGPTPRERREVARDRYQTYTITSPTVPLKAAETVREIPALTPRQRRQVTRERYQTYTIATAHEEQKTAAAEERAREGEGARNEVRKSATVGDVPAMSAKKTTSRVTPKQRRLEDRDRFRTRTLDKDCITGSN